METLNQGEKKEKVTFDGCFFLKPKIRCCEYVSTHLIFGVGQDSTKIFSEAPDPKLTGAKGKFSVDFNRLWNKCTIFPIVTGNSGAVRFELSPGFMSFSA